MGARHIACSTFVLWLAATPAAAQLSVEALEAAGARIDTGQERAGCAQLEAAVRAARLPVAQRRALVHRHRGFARWARLCVERRLRTARRARGKEEKWTLLRSLRGSPLLADREQERRVHRAIAAAPRPTRGDPARAPVPYAGLSGGDVTRVMRTASVAMRRCVEREIARGGPPARVRLAIRIRADGRVRSVRLEGRPPAQVALERCLRSALAPLRFPPPGHGEVRVVYPLFYDVAG